MKSKRLQLLLLVSLIVALPTTSISEDKIKVGVSVPLRGGGAAYGSDILNGLRFANQELLGSRYELITEDDNCTAKDSVSVAQKFTSLTKVPYVLGFACSGCVLASAPIYEKAHTIAITSGATAPDISKAGEFIFRTHPSSDSGASLLHSHLASKHKKVGVISEETDYAQGVLNGLVKANSNNTLELITHNYLPSDSDFRTIIEKLRADKVEGVVLNPQSEDRLILLVKQLKESALKVPLYGFIYPSSPTFLTAVGTLSEGIVFADTPTLFEALGEEGKRLQTIFVAKYGEPKSSEFYVLASILAFQALDQAIRAGGDVQQNLSSKEFDGVVGKFRFDPNGDIEKFGYMMKIISGGKATMVNH